MVRYFMDNFIITKMSKKQKAQKEIMQGLEQIQEEKKKFLMEQFQKDIQRTILRSNIELLETIFQATYQEDSKARELVESMLLEFRNKLEETKL